MKDREKKFILKFATEREENDLRITNGKKYDLTPDILDFIDELISERDKELEILTSTVGYITAKYGEDNEVVKHFKGLLNK